MASIKEINRKAEQLIEQGNKAQQAVKACQSRVAALSNEVLAARIELADASQTDEEGNTVGDVGAAQARLNMIENQLEAGHRALEQAKTEVERINSQKEAQVQEISRHNEVSKANLDKLSKLSSMAFSENAEGLSAGIAERFNEAEDVRVALLRSMGKEVSPSYVRVNREGSASMGMDGGGVSSFDGFDKEQHDSGRGVGSFSTPIAAAAAGAAVGASAAAIASGGVASRSKDNFEPKSLLGLLFDSDVKSTHASIFSRSKKFCGFEIEDNGFSGGRYIVKGNHYDEFCSFSKNYEIYENVPVGKVKTISARDIEGVYINPSEVADPHYFWNRNGQYPIDSEKYFIQIASLIPTVEALLASGKSPLDFEENSFIEACYNLYFADPVEVSEVDGFYVFNGERRHRIMAAQKLGYDIPVNVVRRYTKSLGVVTSHENLKTYMSEKYGVVMSRGIRNLDFNSVKSALEGVEVIISEFPEVGYNLSGIAFTRNAVMASTGSRLFFSRKYYQDPRVLEAAIVEQCAEGGWPPNTSATSIGVHEATHCIEWALIKMNPQYSDSASMRDAWENSREATKIVEQACDNLKMTSYGWGKRDDELISSISLYAMENNSETLAEAFADVYANGEYANPLSLEIRRLTKEVYEKYKGGF